MGERYRSAIKNGFPMRTMLTHLPEAIPILKPSNLRFKLYTEIQPTIDAISSFMRRDLDIMLLPLEEAGFSMVLLLPRYLPVTSICYISETTDSLAKKAYHDRRFSPHRTLLVNGGSSQTLRQGSTTCR